MNLKQTAPKKYYYLYNGDGVVYDIVSTEPTPEQLNTGGGYFYPYFESNYYEKDSDNKLTLKFGKTTIKTTSNITAFNQGTLYDNQGIAITQVQKEKEISHGTVAAMPSCSFTEDGKTITYYFDELINQGDTYNKKENKFSAMNNESTPDFPDTYGTLLRASIEDAIDLNQFVTSVSKIPACLRDIDNATPNNLDSYGLTKDEFVIYGELYVELLLKELKIFADKKIKAVKSSIKPADPFKDMTVDITSTTNALILNPTT